jgi:hypothetical protein
VTWSFAPGWWLWAAVGPRDVDKRGVDGLSGGVVGVGPEVRVGVEGLGGAGVSEAGLDDSDGLAVADGGAGGVVPQRVEPAPGGYADGGHGAAPGVGEAGAADRFAALAVIQSVIATVTNTVISQKSREGHAMTHARPSSRSVATHDHLGLEVRADMPFGRIRWLTVWPAFQPDVEIMLEDTQQVRTGPPRGTR